MKRVMLVLVCGLAFGAAAQAQRLPGNVIPESYELTFTPDLPKAVFTGTETIHVRVEHAANSIVLNSAEIEFQDVTVSSGGAEQKASVIPDEKAEQTTFTVPKEIAAGSAAIHIHFTGTLNDKLRGFYLSQTPRRRYAVTQFEATDARRAFPSFDQPDMKAVFHITIVADKGDTAISNTSIESDTPGPGEGKHTLKFAASPKMSSYLVALLVGDFQCLEGSADEIPIRVCATPEKKDQGAFALTTAENVLKYYDKYYYTKYPFKKLDFIGIPDFSAGAMENIGAITYREADLLIDDKTASYDSHRNIASVIAHEMAHQWFGDLVTMKWWDNIWLNEGFATWMSWKPLEAWHPEWHNELDEIEETGGALTTDSIASVRPIRAKAETPAEIGSLFDGIAYGKAASVLRAMEAYVGPDTFRKGVNAYLEKHAYGNTTAEDFWNQIAATSGKPVDKIMSGYVDQPGAPLVSVKSVCHGNATSVTLTQTRYFADAAKLNAGSKELWEVPVSLRSSVSNDAKYELLTGREQTFELPGCAQWVLANEGARGYYRVQYELADFAKISAELESRFSPEDRIRFLGDTWAMVRVGRLSIADYLNTLEKMQGDRERAVVDVMLGHLPEIHDEVVSPAERPAFEAWVRNFLRPIAHDLGSAPTAGESQERQALRTDVFGTLAAYGRDPELIAQSRLLTDAYMKDPSSVEEALAANALSVSAQNGDATLYDKYVEHLKTAKTPGEYYGYLGSLALFPDPALTKRTFDFVLSPAVRNQDMFALVGTLTNPDTQAVGWDLFKTDYKQITAKIDASLGGELAQIAGIFCDPKLRDDSLQFFRNQNISGSARLLENAKDQANACIELRTDQQSNLSAFLKK
ncbi:MAG: M1 family metallopeptidase [Candidatus Acidiferrales bacterium]|jgi:aminopeptidase N